MSNNLVRTYAYRLYRCRVRALLRNTHRHAATVTRQFFRRSYRRRPSHGSSPKHGCRIVVSVPDNTRCIRARGRERDVVSACTRSGSNTSAVRVTIIDLHGRYPKRFVFCFFFSRVREPYASPTSRSFPSRRNRVRRSVDDRCIRGVRKGLGRT